jgi:hypothetical protein
MAETAHSGQAAAGLRLPANPIVDLAGTGQLFQLQGINAGCQEEYAETRRTLTVSTSMPPNLCRVSEDGKCRSAQRRQYIA